MENVSGSLATAAIDAVKNIFTCLKRKYDYVKNIEGNLDKLEKEKGSLLDVRNDVERELEGKKDTHDKTETCKTWLNEVEDVDKGIVIVNLKNDYRNTRSYLCGICPFPGLLRLGKFIVTKTKDVVELKNQRAQMDIMVEKLREQPVPFIEMHVQNLDDLPPLNSHVEKLLGWLDDMKLKRICIFGPPGVGKTTIMKNLHNRVGRSGKFDMIFWVTVTAEGNPSEILDEIWNRLDMKMDGRFHQKARKISEFLEDKKYVLFLDLNNLSSEIKLREVGIHNEHVHGKVVFACRCKSDNIIGDTDEEMKVKTLSKKNAANVFWKVVGSDLKSDPEIKPPSKLIIKECGGMLHVIQLIGKKLAGEKDPAIWRHTLKNLRSPSKRPLESLEEVYKAFSVVYEELPEDVRPCLLYWAVFPAGYEISRDHIIDCWRAEQFLSSQERLPVIRDDGHAILNEFEKKFLLEKGRTLGHFKMYEYFQRAALRIANSSFNFIVKEEEKIREEEWERATRVSLIRVHPSNLPKRPQCRGILSLLLRETSLTEFPREFFGYMRDLQVLNLHETRIAALPSSISSLINLKGLFLNKSGQLLQLPSEIGDLQSLEILDMHGLYSLPVEIGQLTNLKCLRVSFTEDVDNHNHVEEMRPMIPSNVILNLTELEELSIGVRHNSSRYQNVAEIANEISGLQELTTLCFFFPDMTSFQTFIQNRRSWRRNEAPAAENSFRSFSIVVGCQQDNASEFSTFECSAEKHLTFSAGDESPGAILEVLKQAKAFKLIGHQTATSLSVFGAKNLQGLEACIIEECNKMESIIVKPGVELERLESLHLNNLPRLEKISSGSNSNSIEYKSLCRLTTLTLKGCRSIRTLCLGSMILCLSQLQELQVEDCCIMKEIIEDGSTVNPEAFPKLKKLQLYDLPSLCSISHVPLQWRSLETILIKTCMNLKNLPKTVENASRLRIIQCTEAWWNLQDWPANGIIENRFREFRSLIPPTRTTTLAAVGII